MRYTKWSLTRLIIVNNRVGTDREKMLGEGPPSEVHHACVRYAARYSRHALASRPHARPVRRVTIAYA